MADRQNSAAPSPAFDTEAYVRAAAPAVGFTLNAEEVEAAAVQIERAAQFAAIVSAARDDPKTTPAPVFSPDGKAAGERSS